MNEEIITFDVIEIERHQFQNQNIPILATVSK